MKSAAIRELLLQEAGASPHLPKSLPECPVERRPRGCHPPKIYSGRDRCPHTIVDQVWGEVQPALRNGERCS